jgi:cytochrome c oxidase subunit 3/cytochrome c oxidase subunit I+III
MSSAYGVTHGDGAAAVPRARTLPNAFWGMVVFLATEATLFGVLLGTYFYLRFRVGPWPPAGIPKPAWVTPLVLTAVLLATSFPMQPSWRAARDGRRRAAWWALLIAFTAQLLYLVWQLVLFSDDIPKVRPHTTAYGSIYLTLLGADHLHVCIGVLLDAWLLAKLATRLTRYRLNGLQATTLYWHVVNGLTVLVLLAQLSPYV